MNENFEVKNNQEDNSPTWDHFTDQVQIDQKFPNPSDHLRSHQEEIATKKYIGNSEDSELEKAA